MFELAERAPGVEERARARVADAPAAREVEAAQRRAARRSGERALGELDEARVADACAALDVELGEAREPARRPPLADRAERGVSERAVRERERDEPVRA